MVEALRYAETLSDDVALSTWTWIRPQPSKYGRKWESWGGRVQLVVLQSLYRSVMKPLLEYIETHTARSDD